MIGIFEDTLLCTYHANRLTVMQKDMQLANRIRNKQSWAIKWDWLSDTLLFVYLVLNSFEVLVLFEYIDNPFLFLLRWKKYKFNALLAKTIILLFSSLLLTKSSSSAKSVSWTISTAKMGSVYPSIWSKTVLLSSTLQKGYSSTQSKIWSSRPILFRHSYNP